MTDFTPKVPLSDWPVGLPRQTPLQVSLHRAHWDERARLIFALWDSPNPRLKAKAFRQASCGTGASIGLDMKVRRPKLFPRACHERGCPFCSKGMAAKRTAKFLIAVLSMSNPWLMTLTVKHLDIPLSDQVTEMERCWQQLLRSKFFKKYLAGGIRRLEIKVSEKDLLWHVHLHIIFDALGFPAAGDLESLKAIKAELRKEWRKVTAGSYIVDLEPVDDVEGSVAKLLRYISKPEKILMWTPAQIREYFAAVHNKRAMQCFGNQFGKKTVEAEAETEPKENTPHVKVSRLTYLAWKKYDKPLEALPLIAARWPIFATFIYNQDLRVPRAPPVAKDFTESWRFTRKHPHSKRAKEAFTLAKAKLEEAIFTVCLEILEDEEGGYFSESTWSDFYVEPPVWKSPFAA